MKAQRALIAFALLLSYVAGVFTAPARVFSQQQASGLDFDGNGTVNAADLVGYVTGWVASQNVTPTPVPPTATATATATRTATPIPATATPTPTPTIGAAAQRMVVVVLENRNLADVQANPYFASLAARGKLLTNYLTIANPSQPNYVAMNFGDTMGVTSNSVVNIPGRNIVDLLEEAGVSWKTYHEDYPGNCSPVERAGGASGIDYARKHNAFISSDTVRNDPARCAKIVDALAFEADIAAGTVPRYSVFVPDKDNSSHDTSIAFAANWLSGWLEPKLSNPSLADVLWVITWDEGEDWGNVPISTILVGPGVQPGTTDATLYNHYALLRTTQVFFGLGTLGRNDANAPVIPLGGGALPTPTATSPPATPTRTPTATFLPFVTSTPTPTPTATRTPGGSSMAFGDVSVLDAFTRADGGLGSNWTTDAAQDGAAAPRIVSNTGAAASGGGYSSAYYNVASYTGDKQAYITLSTLPESPRYAGVGFVYGPGASTVDGYHVEYRVGRGIIVYRIDNTVFTQLGADISWTPSAGHKLGIRVDETNGVIEAWTHNGTSWSQAGTRSDSTYSGAAYGEIYLRGNSTRIDDFAAGSETVAGINGELTATLADATLSGTGTVDIAGTTDATLGAATLSATGTVDIVGTASATLADATLSATGTLDIAGTTSATLADATLSSAATLDIAGTASATLGDATLSATGTVDLTGATSATLADATLSATGTVDIVGTLTGTLADATVVAEGVIGSAPIEGTLSATLDAAALSATSTLDIQGALGATLADATLSSTGTLDIAGVTGGQLADVTLVATGTVDLFGVTAVVLEAATVTATGAVDISGALAVTLDAATLSAAGSDQSVTAVAYAAKMAMRGEAAMSMQAEPRLFMRGERAMRYEL